MGEKSRLIKSKPYFLLLLPSKNHNLYILVIRYI